MYNSLRECRIEKGEKSRDTLGIENDFQRVAHVRDDVASWIEFRQEEVNRNIVLSVRHDPAPMMSADKPFSFGE